MDWTQWATLVSAIAGIATAIQAMWSSLAATRRKRQDVLQLADEAQEMALSSSDIAILGRYVTEEIGSVRVSDLVSDPEVRRRTRRALARVADFIVPEEGLASQKPSLSPDTGTHTTPLIPGELQRAQEDVLSGEVWNGLARMRRHVELVLKASIPSRHDSRLGAGQLIAEGGKLGILGPDSVQQLRYAIGIANEAIHGQSTPPDVALEAIGLAAHALQDVKARP